LFVDVILAFYFLAPPVALQEEVVEGRVEEMGKGKPRESTGTLFMIIFFWGLLRSVSANELEKQLF
jgi:hypothetical protein